MMMMHPQSQHSTLIILKHASGAAGNIFAVALFISPTSTFRRIIRNKSTEHFSGLPYIYGLLNCLICMWYGSPFVSEDNILIMSVNSLGAAFQLVYVIVFITNAEHSDKVRMSGLLVAVIGVFVFVAAGSLQIPDHALRRITVGLLSGCSLISMFASPLFIINLVIRTKSVEFMPFYLSLSTFLMSASFLLYGVFNDDMFIYVPNGIGTLLGIIQLLLYAHYSRKSRDKLKTPLMESLS
ncbi:hypothetical protein MLD38_035134 [Melastoma candidum]|uniref:Uncharacterized protein n=1 Tax=Melastoma candidum TaxID=119954 RepID=A0ACB9MDT8_9MYRT|nr:hypothetical protein MLD38_035134 [Melastoma candidum]